MTIYALSTGPGISGVAIVRVSGANTKKVIKLLTNKTVPDPRVATPVSYTHLTLPTTPYV